MTYSDYEWYLQNDLSKYAGKWIAIINKKVIAFGVEPAHVLKQAKEKYPNKKPLLTKIRDKLAILSS